MRLPARSTGNSAFGPNKARFRLCRRFLVSTRGVAAVELAIVLPLLMLMLFGSIEIGTAIVIKSKVRTAASTMAEIANQYSTIQDSDMASILSTTAAVMAPYAASNAAAVISEISIDNSGNAKVTWSDTLSGTARTVGSAVVVPSGIAGANTTLLLSEVSYRYSPSLGYVMTGSLTLSDSLYATPRNGSSITRSP